MNKFYKGIRDDAGARVYIVTTDDSGLFRQERELPPRLDLRDHSPTGLEWGYGGSGPSQLALAICADVLDDDRKALKVYQEFKWKVVAELPQEEGWVLTENRVRAVLREFLEYEA